MGKYKLTKDRLFVYCSYIAGYYSAFSFSVLYE